MHLIPADGRHPGGVSIPWRPADAALRRWAAGSPEYAAAAAGAPG
jgi:hypothetical protein